MTLYFDETVLGFDDVNYWAFLLVFGLIFACLLLANVLIQVIKPLKKALIPSPVLGGFILLLVLGIYRAIVGTPLFNGTVFEMITYHGLGLGFVATALKKPTQAEIEAKKKSKSSVFNSSLVTVGGYLIQACVGLIISVVLFLIIGKGYPASGSLLPMGFGQGPGQAMNWGKNFESTLFEGVGTFTDGKSFGLAIAALGFISASVGGVIYIIIHRAKGNPKFKGTEGEDVPMDTLETYAGENEIPHSGTIDKTSVQIGIVLLTYLISFLIIFGISKLCDLTYTGDPNKPGFLVGTVKPLFWGFNFIVGTGVAVGVKALLNLLKKTNLVKKEYVNNYMMDRISGVSFDFMVVAAIGSIDLLAFKNPEFVLPLVIMGVVGCAATYIYCEIVCKHLFAKYGYEEESFLSLFGMLTGTASTGVILLREIDPAFKTPALNNMVFQTLWSVVLGAPVLLLMGTVAKGWGSLALSFGIFAVYFVVVMLLIFRDKIFVKKEK